MSTDAVVIWGELLWDRYVDPDPRDATRGGVNAPAPPAHPVGRASLVWQGERPLSIDELGGAPANFAWHFALAGGWAQLVTRLGDDALGRRALARLAGVVDTSLIQLDAARATGEVTIRVEDGEARYTLVPGRAWEHIACTDDVRAAIDEAGVLVYGTLAQRTAEGHAQWLHAVTAAGSRTTKVYDANLRPNDRASHAIESALDHADIIKLNDREVDQIAAMFGWRDPVAHLRERPRARPRIVVVTHGAHGSTIYPASGAAIEIAGVAAAPGGDNVGCGDAYLALFIFGMTSGWDLATSGRIASGWAAAVASVRGATPLLDDDHIAALLEGE
jgi:fructokinase